MRWFKKNSWPKYAPPRRTNYNIKCRGGKDAPPIYFISTPSRRGIFWSNNLLQKPKQKSKKWHFACRFVAVGLSPTLDNTKQSKNKGATWFATLDNTLWCRSDHDQLAGILPLLLDHWSCTLPGVSIPKLSSYLLFYFFYFFSHISVCFWMFFHLFFDFFSVLRLGGAPPASKNWKNQKINEKTSKNMQKIWEKKK